MSIATVVKVEPKTTSSGKSYWRAQFQPGGWASTWSSTVGKMLSEKVGQQVEVDLQKSADGQFTNIISAKAIEMSNPEAEAAHPAGQRDHLIVRQVALKAAVEWGAYADVKPMAEQVIQIATKFASWIEGRDEPSPDDEIPF